IRLTRVRFARLRIARIGLGYLGTRDKRAQIPRHRPRLLQGHRSAEGRHDGAPALQNGACQLAVRSRSLPARVGKIGNVGNVPHSPAVHGVAADAVAVVKAHHHAFFLLGATQPIPRAFEFVAVPRRLAVVSLATMIPTKQCATGGLDLVARTGLEGEASQEASTYSGAYNRSSPDTVSSNHSLSRTRLVFSPTRSADPTTQDPAETTSFIG